MLLLFGLLLICSTAHSMWRTSTYCSTCTENPNCEVVGNLCYIYEPPSKDINAEDVKKILPPDSVFVFYGDSIIRSLYVEALAYFGHREWFFNTRKTVYEQISQFQNISIGERDYMDHTYLCSPPLVDFNGLTLAFLWKPDMNWNFFGSRPWEESCKKHCGYAANISRCDGSHRATVDLRWQCGDAIDSLKRNVSIANRKFFVFSGAGIHAITGIGGLRSHVNMSDPETHFKIERVVNKLTSNMVGWSKCQQGVRENMTKEIYIMPTELRPMSWLKKRTHIYNPIRSILMKNMETLSNKTNAVFTEMYDPTAVCQGAPCLDGIHYYSVFYRVLWQKLLQEFVMK